MPIPRPPQGVRWLFTQTATYDVLIAIFASAIGFSSAWNYASANRWRLATIVFCGTVGVVVVTLCKHIIGLAAARKKDSTHELEGCLYTLHVGRIPVPHDDKPIGLREWQRGEQHAADDREDRGGGAYPQRQGQNRDGGKSRSADQQPKGVSRIVQHVVVR